MERFNTNDEAYDWLEENGQSEKPGWSEFAKAIIGVTTDERIVYSYERITECLMETDDISEEDAIEYVDYNVVGSLNPKIEESPIIIHEIQSNKRIQGRYNTSLGFFLITKNSTMPYITQNMVQKPVIVYE